MSEIPRPGFRHAVTEGQDGTDDDVTSLHASESFLTC